MTVQVREFAVTIPAGTAIAAPVTISTAFEPLAVDKIDIWVPPGPLGQMGFRVASSRQQVIPWNAGAWVIANDELLSFPGTAYPNSGDWQVIGYNTGAFPHTIYVTFSLSLVPSDAPIGVQVSTVDLSTADLSGVGA